MKIKCPKCNKKIKEEYLFRHNKNYHNDEKVKLHNVNYFGFKQFANNKMPTELMLSKEGIISFLKDATIIDKESNLHSYTLKNGKYLHLNEDGKWIEDKGNKKLRMVILMFVFRNIINAKDNIDKQNEEGINIVKWFQEVNESIDYNESRNAIYEILESQIKNVLNGILLEELVEMYLNECSKRTKEHTNYIIQMKKEEIIEDTDSIEIDVLVCDENNKINNIRTETENSKIRKYLINMLE